MKSIVFYLLILVSAFSFAQTSGRLTLHGKVKHKKSVINSVFIEIYKDNELMKTADNMRNGAFVMQLDLGSVYNISFSKKGYIAKSVAVVAKADSSTTIKGRYFFQLDIELFKEEDHEEDESILPPVAKLYIKDESKGFRYDKKYVRWVAGHYED